MPDLNAAIKPLAPLLGEPCVIRALDDIFYEASSRQSFVDGCERALFRERWLGRYLGADAANGFVALATDKPDEAPRIAGYVVGALDNPAASARFSDIGHYRDFARQCLEFPAHLHINLHADFRNRELGAQLIEAFCVHARDAMLGGGSGHAAAGAGAAPKQAAPAMMGVHVVTSAPSRNVRFYNKLGFREQARIRCGGDEVVFLGRRL